MQVDGQVVFVQQVDGQVVFVQWVDGRVVFLQGVDGHIFMPLDSCALNWAYILPSKLNFQQNDLEKPHVLSEKD